MRERKLQFIVDGQCIMYRHSPSSGRLKKGQSCRFTIIVL